MSTHCWHRQSHLSLLGHRSSNLTTYRLNARESLREKSRLFMTAPHDICLENGIEIIAVNRRSLVARRATLEISCEPRLSTEEGKHVCPFLVFDSLSGHSGVESTLLSKLTSLQNKVIAIQVQVDSETTRDCPPKELIMVRPSLSPLFRSDLKCFP